tara:strand:+ start:19577 stop:21385 length:1809 start_codon:yes stop_codon:yes gene_type:complete
MCGFIGTISLDKKNSKVIEKANRYIECRGPDSKIHTELNFKDLTDSSDNKYFNGIFNRLSILELSDNANQPMFSKDKTSILMFNGEIYNFLELKEILVKKGYKFKTNNSDTEVLLKLLCEYGIDCVDMLIGQFAFTYIDLKKNTTYLCRDRLGQKPLFFSKSSESISFSSNLKSLREILDNNNLDEDGLFDYISLGVIPSPRTIFKDIYKLEPGFYAEINLDNFEIIEKQYWNPTDFIDNKKFDYSKFYKLFNESVDYRLISDVPVACYLSGGIDSSTIIKSLSENKVQDINTFSMITDNQKYDESKWSKLVSQKYKTTHVEEFVSSKITTNEILESIDIFDEPYSDPSTVVSFKLAKTISNDFKVAISGDGGDELLFGYERSIKWFLKRKLNSKFINFIFSLYPSFLGTGQNILSRSNNIEDYSKTYFRDTKLTNLFGLKANNVKINKNLNINDYKYVFLQEFQLYLSEMMMLKVDRTSMANSLEVRSPFVDHRLIEYILSTETNWISLKEPKKLMKKYLSSDFEPNFLNRKKQGFVFELEDWVFKNKKFIYEYIKEGILSEYLDLKKLKYLTIIKTRINSQRLWRLFFLTRYLERVNNGD